MTQDDALAGLQAAYDAANAALEKAQDDNSAASVVSRINDAADLALHCLTQAMKETLTVVNQHTQEIQSDLDKITAQLNDALKSDIKVVAVVDQVDQLVKLAAALASAFG